jgi:hypothetical protein
VEFQAWVEANLLVEADLMEPGAAQVVDARTFDELYKACRDAGATATWQGSKCVFFTRISSPCLCAHALWFVRFPRVGYMVCAH